MVKGAVEKSSFGDLERCDMLTHVAFDTALNALKFLQQCTELMIHSQELKEIRRYAP